MVSKKCATPLRRPQMHGCVRARARSADTRKLLAGKPFEHDAAGILGHHATDPTRLGAAGTPAERAHARPLPD